MRDEFRRCLVPVGFATIDRRTTDIGESLDPVAESVLLEDVDVLLSRADGVDWSGVMQPLSEAAVRALGLYECAFAPDVDVRVEQTRAAIARGARERAARLRGETRDDQDSNPSALVPLIAATPAGIFSWTAAVSCQFEHVAASDIIQVAHVSTALDDDFKQTLRDAAAAARLVAGRRPARAWLFSLPEKGVHYEGGSIGLAAAIAALDAMGAAEVGDRRRLRRSVVATGAVDPRGRVGSVGENGIAAKTQSALLSGAAIFLVPIGNEATARSTLEGIREEHPAAALEIVAVKTVMETWRDPRITRREKIPRTIRRRAGPLLGLFLVAASAWLGVPVVARLFGPELERAHFRPPDLLVGIPARGGEAIWERHLPIGPSRDAATVDDRWIETADFSGDGHREVAALVGECDAKNEHPPMLLLYDHHGDELWRRRLGPELEGGSLDGPLGCFYPSEVSAIRSADGSMLILAEVIHSSSYPTQLVLFDAEGEVVGEYWHPGVIYNIYQWDLAEDGEEELILVGTHNHVGSGVVIVTRPELLDGQAPPFRAYRGPQPAHHLAYIRFPKSSLVPPDNRSNVFELRDRSAEGFSVLVEESDGARGGTVWYHFNADLSWRDRWPDGDYQAAAFENVAPQLKLRTTLEWLDEHVGDPEAHDGGSWVAFEPGRVPPECVPSAIAD